MSEYNGILELGMQNNLHFPVGFVCFVQPIPLLGAWETWSFFLPFRGNAWRPDFGIHNCLCTRNTPSTCASTYKCNFISC